MIISKKVKGLTSLLLGVVIMLGSYTFQIRADGDILTDEIIPKLQRCNETVNNLYDLAVSYLPTKGTKTTLAEANTLSSDNHYMVFSVVDKGKGNVTVTRVQNSQDTVLGTLSIPSKDVSTSRGYWYIKDESLGECSFAEKVSKKVYPLPDWGSRYYSSPFGQRISPITGASEFHLGVDIPANLGTDIYAVMDGVVTYAGWSEQGYGNLVEIDHGNGIVTRYAHCSEVLCSVGQKVNSGDVVALIGTTGNSTGCHLHFEYRINGEPTNPVDYINSVG